MNRLSVLLSGVLLLSTTVTHAVDTKVVIPPGTQTFVTYRYRDPLTGMEAFRLLIPKGWKAEGSVQWSENPALPVQSRFRFRNPAGREELSFFPTRARFWTDNRLFLTTNPPGTLRFGTMVARPVSLRDAFTRIIIPEERKGVTNLTIVKETNLPELASLAKGQPVRGVDAAASGGKMRIAYRDGGRNMEEEIFASLAQFVTHLPATGMGGGYFINYWYLDTIFSCRSEMGTLDSKAGLFKTMITSVRVNPLWFAKVTNVKEMLAQQAIRGIKSVGKIGETVAKAGSQMREEQQRDWERRQEAQDRISRNFSDHIRGVDRFNDPRAGREVELPSGYGTAWANGLGDYVVTESPSYNPNINSNQHWEQLTPVK